MSAHLPRDLDARRVPSELCNVLTHEIMGCALHHGVLVSRGIVGDDRVTGMYSEAQAMRFWRVRARKFLRLVGPGFSMLEIFGDCGAFSYHKEDKPPYAPEDVAELYDKGGFTHGCSVDHIIFDFDRGARAWKADRRTRDGASRSRLGRTASDFSR